MKIRFGKRAVVLTMAAALALGACSSAEDAPSDGEDTNGSDVGADMTLRLPIQAQPSTFQIGQPSAGESYLYLAVYDTLVARDADAELVPAVAESWEYSEDRTTLTFTIREGMTFTDGSPVDAEAVAASLEATRTGPANGAQMAKVATIEAPDASTVVLTLSEPDAGLLHLFAGQAGAIGAPDLLTDESSALEPVGSGPYVLDQDATTVGAVYTLTKNPDHWNADAFPFGTVEMRVLSDPVAMQNAMQAGQIDFMTASQDQLALFPEGQYTSGESLPQAVAALWLVDREGGVVPELEDLRVRQAINLAIDREGIAESINPGTTIPTNQVVSPLGEAYDEALLDEHAYDVEAAKALMAEAGYADGFDLVLPSTPLSTAYESILSQQLSDIGIRATWESVPFQDFFAKVAGGSYGLFYMYNGLSGSDAGDITASLQGLFNPFGSTTPELQELLDTANAATPEEQGAAFGEVNAYFVEEAWFAPINYSTGYWVTSTEVDYTPARVAAQSLQWWSPAATS